MASEMMDTAFTVNYLQWHAQTSASSLHVAFMTHPPPLTATHALIQSMSLPSTLRPV